MFLTPPRNWVQWRGWGITLFVFVSQCLALVSNPQHSAGPQNTRWLKKWTKECNRHSKTGCDSTMYFSPFNVGARREFPGSPGVRTLHFYCRGPGSVPGGGTKIPQVSLCGQKKKKKSWSQESVWELGPLPSPTSIFPPPLWMKRHKYHPFPNLYVKYKFKTPRWFLSPGPSFKNSIFGTSLVVQWLRLCAPSAGCTGSIPGRVTTILHAAQHSKEKKKKKHLWPHSNSEWQTGKQTAQSNYCLNHQAG